MAGRQNLRSDVSTPGFGVGPPSTPIGNKSFGFLGIEGRVISVLS
jgi:hypothetical protein